MKRLALIVAAIFCAAGTASAYLQLNVISVTPTDLTLSLSNTLGMPSGDPIPDTHAKLLTLESPGTEWITNDGTHDITLLRGGMAPLSTDSYDWSKAPIASRGDSFGDFVQMYFYYDLVAGTSQGSGNEFTLHSDTPIFRTSGYTLSLYWSWRGEWPQPFGVYQSSDVVPEPSTYALFGGVAALGCAAIVRRRRQK
jgi:hypothetical protein